jgi:hypothetical protein
VTTKTHSTDVSQYSPCNVTNPTPGCVRQPYAALSNAQDSCGKLVEYLRLVDAEADAGLVDAEWRNPAPAKGWGKVGV